jgi:hypothetical protein
MAATSTATPAGNIMLRITSRLNAFQYGTEFNENNPQAIPVWFIRWLAKIDFKVPTQINLFLCFRTVGDTD